MTNLSADKVYAESSKTRIESNQLHILDGEMRELIRRWEQANGVTITHIEYATYGVRESGAMASYDVSDGNWLYIETGWGHPTEDEQIKRPLGFLRIIAQIQPGDHR